MNDYMNSVELDDLREYEKGGEMRGSIYKK